MDALLVVIEPDPSCGRLFREPVSAELEAAAAAAAVLADERAFSPLLPAVPNEAIPENNGATIRPQLYGAKTYGDLMVARQTLSFVRLCRAINSVSDDLRAAGLSANYVKALSGYAAAVLVRMLKFSTRGAKMRSTPGAGLVDHIFANEGAIAFSYDFFEVGLGDGPGSWPTMASGTLSTLVGLYPAKPGVPVVTEAGTAVSLPFRSGSMTAVVTDPPYDAMVYYTDSSDFFYVWLKRALQVSHPELSVTSDLRGLQEKSDEIIVKEHGRAPGEHRDREHYDSKIAQAFGEARRVLVDGGIVTIVFGHGEPEVWQRLLRAIEAAGLIMTASWPARTESGGQQGKANIETTLTMACRAAPISRPTGRRSRVEDEIKVEVRRRYPDWERWGLAPTDMLMAAAGPAMEIAGRYSQVLDVRGEPVAIEAFLPLARAAVQEAMAVEIDHYPLETFDTRTRFALWWVRVYGRSIAPKSELRWQTLAASLDLTDVRDLVPDVDKGCQFVSAAKHNARISAESSVIDVLLALARVSDQGLSAMGDVLVSSGRTPDDPYLWAAATFLADRLRASDPDSVAFTRVIRNRSGIGRAAESIRTADDEAAKERQVQESQLTMF